MANSEIWDGAFWLITCENHTQRIRAKQWTEVLMDHADRIIVRGHGRQLVAKNLGYGVVEVSMAPLGEG